MTLRLIVPQAKVRPPVPPIRRKKVEERRELSAETKRKLIALHVETAKCWGRH